MIALLVPNFRRQRYRGIIQNADPAVCSSFGFRSDRSYVTYPSVQWQRELLERA